MGLIGRQYMSFCKVGLLHHLCLTRDCFWENHLDFHWLGMCCLYFLLKTHWMNIPHHLVFFHLLVPSKIALGWNRCVFLQLHLLCCIPMLVPYVSVLPVVFTISITNSYNRHGYTCERRCQKTSVLSNVTLNWMT